MMLPQFFPPFVAFSPKTIADKLELSWAALDGSNADIDTAIAGIAPIEQAAPGDLTFLDNPKYAAHLAHTKALCVVLAPKYEDQLPAGVVGLISRQPYRDFARAAALLVPAGVKLRGTVLNDDISSQAYIDASAEIEPGAIVEPGAVVGARASVGSGAIICAGSVVAHHCHVGRGSYIGPRATVQHALIGDNAILHAGVAIGQDGFGFAMGPQGHLKVPQLGKVVIQDNVEIGAGTCVDRGTTRDTIIGEGTKIDNLVQIGHNVEIGRHCIIVGHVGIAGSSVLEDFVAIGGQSGIAGHLRIGMGAQIAAASNVKDDVPAGARWAGTPAKPARAVFREMAALKRLAERKG